MKIHWHIHPTINGKIKFRIACKTDIKNGCMATSIKEEVTCKRCLKIINMENHPLKKTKKPNPSPRLEIGHDMQPSALGKYPSIEAWEDAHGRGFWGSPAHGYTYDKDNK